MLPPSTVPHGMADNTDGSNCYTPLYHNLLVKDSLHRSVWDYLEQHNYQMERVAVEYNGEILQRAQYQSVILQPDDVLEIVSFVGGG